MEHDETAKLVLVGELGAGKSSLLLRFAENRYSEDFQTTIALDLKVKTVEVHGSRMQLQLWDTAGQERFRSITSSYYRQARGVMLAFDVSDRLSFEALGRWLDDARRCTSSAAVLVVACKGDLERAVSLGEAQQWAKDRGLLYVETSAKLGVGVDDAFLLLAAAVHRQREQRFESSNILSHKARRRRRC